jgi:hypothetical protein
MAKKILLSSDTLLYRPRPHEQERATQAPVGQPVPHRHLNTPSVSIDSQSGKERVTVVIMSQCMEYLSRLLMLVPLGKRLTRGGRCNQQLQISNHDSQSCYRSVRAHAIERVQSTDCLYEMLLVVLPFVSSLCHFQGRTPNKIQPMRGRPLSLAKG